MYTIIGGGIIGLSTAYYLQQAGADVQIIEKSDLSDGCSFGNAGMIVPSHFIPLATPGMMAKGMRWMFSAKSPFYIKPRLSTPLVQWLWQFYRACSPQRVQAAIPVLRDLGLWSKQLYQELAQHPELNFAYQEKGLLMLYQSAKAEKEELEMAEQANKVGIEAQILSSSEVQKLEKATQVNARGAVYFPGDAHLSPNLLMNNMISYLKKSGVKFRDRTTVEGFTYDQGKVNSIQTTTGQSIPVQELIVAGGSWTPQVLKKLGIKMLLQDGKGYSVTQTKGSDSPSIPSILTEAKVAMTPMADQLRIGGTLEISNMSSKISLPRVEGILEAVPKYYPKLRPSVPKKEKVWHGFRPCTPDGLPYIGRSKHFNNLTIATGHAMMGLSLGPATGKLVSELLTADTTTLSLQAFNPQRY